jgi:rare lipoprotein A
LRLFFLLTMLFKLFSASLLSAFAFLPSPALARSGCGYASHYGHGDNFHGRIAADGSRFNAYGLTLASRSIPFGARVQVVNPANGRSVIARSSDRGPFVPGRVLDLSFATFAAIADPSKGVTKVCYKIV